MLARLSTHSPLNPPLADNNMIVFTIGGKSAFEVPVSEVQQTDKDARKTEISLMFPAPPGNVCANLAHSCNCMVNG